MACSNHRNYYLASRGCHFSLEFTQKSGHLVVNIHADDINTMTVQDYAARCTMAKVVINQLVNTMTDAMLDDARVCSDLLDVTSPIVEVHLNPLTDDYQPSHS